MKRYALSHISKNHLKDVHPDLVRIMKEAISYSPVDFGITCGARSFELQLEHFKNDVSELDPRDPEQLKRAKHVITDQRPLAEAVDIYVYVPGRKDLAYDKHLLTMAAGHVQGVSKKLYLDGEIEHVVRWGGNWDMDREIITDQNFDDLPHFEIQKPLTND